MQVNDDMKYIGPCGPAVCECWLSSTGLPLEVVKTVAAGATRRELICYAQLLGKNDLLLI